MDARKVLLYLALGSQELYQSWSDLLRDMQKRGLRQLVLIITDGVPGLSRAVEEVFAHSLRQRCLVHKARNVTDKASESAQGEVKAAAQAICYAPLHGVAEKVAVDALKNYQATYPSARKCFQDDWETCMAYLRSLSTNLLQTHPHDQPDRTEFPGKMAADQGDSALFQ